MRWRQSQEFALLQGLLSFRAEKTNREEQHMESFENIISMLDFTLNTQRKRHIVGGLLLSVSLLFGGLALTAMTLKMEDNDE